MLEFHYPIEVHIYKTRLFSHHEFLHFIRMYSTTDLRTRKLLMRQKRGLFSVECVKKRYLLFTCERQHERGEEEDETRTGAPGYAGRLHLFSDSGARATPASVARVPRLVTGRCTPLELALPFSISVSPSLWTSSRCGRPRPPASKRHDESTHAENHPRPFFPTPWMLRIPGLITYMPFLRLANNRTRARILLK